MMFVGRSTASGPFDGIGWELDAIAAVFIGGAAVSGGVGTVIGSIVGGLVMAVLNNGLQLLGVGSDVTQIIKGLVLLVAVAFDVYNKQPGPRRRSSDCSSAQGARGPPRRTRVRSDQDARQRRPRPLKRPASDADLDGRAGASRRPASNGGTPKRERGRR